MIVQLNKTENLIMSWYFDFNNKIGAVMTAPQLNNFKVNITDKVIYEELPSAFDCLLEKEYLKLDSSKNYSLTLKGFNYINNK